MSPLLSALSPFINFFYPNTCLHCQVLINNSTSQLCSFCSDELQLLDHKNRCSYCFSISSFQEYRRCSYCYKKKHYIYKMASCFYYEGVIASLIKAFKYEKKRYLSKALASFLFLQLKKIEWPHFDLIIPIPHSFLRWYQRGFNQSALLAEELEKLLAIPAITGIYKKEGGFSQAKLSKEKRLTLSSENFVIASKQQIYKKKILLIDDVITTGATLNACAHLLIQEGASIVYGLTLSKGQ